MNFENKLEQIKQEHQDKLKSLLKETTMTGKVLLKKYYKTKKMEYMNEVEDLRLVAAKIGQEIDGSATSGGRYFDKMVKKVKQEYKK